MALGLLPVKDPENLFLVALGIFFDLRRRQHPAGRRLVGGVADLGREVADDENHGVAELLKLPELS